MNNYCKKCRLRDGCLQKCKEAEIYEQGYCDGVSDGYKGAVDVLTPYEQQPKLITKIDGLKKPSIFYITFFLCFSRWRTGLRRRRRTW